VKITATRRIPFDILFHYLSKKDSDEEEEDKDNDVDIQEVLLKELKQDLCYKFIEDMPEDSPMIVTLSHWIMHNDLYKDEREFRQNIECKELVPCQYCIYSHPIYVRIKQDEDIYPFLRNKNICNKYNITVTDNFFCADGKRKANDD
jgi:hypothetical protein